MTDTCGGMKVREKKASISTHRTSAPQTTTQASAFVLSSKSFYLMAGLLMLTRCVLELPVPYSAFPEAGPVLSWQCCPHQFSSAFLVNTSFFRLLPTPCTWLFLLCVACGLHPDHSPILNWPKHLAPLHPKAPGDLCQVHPPTHTHQPSLDFRGLASWQMATCGRSLRVAENLISFRFTQN